MLHSGWTTVVSCERWRTDYTHEAVAAQALSGFFPHAGRCPRTAACLMPNGCCAPWVRRITRGCSDASKRSFAVQGGELSRSEAMQLLALEGMDDAMALLRWDDRAKVHGVEVPDLDAYGQVVLDHLM